MLSHYETIKSMGISLYVEGNKPLLLKDPDTLFFVTKGKVDLFSVKLDQQKPAGRRQFLFEVQKNEMIFPLLPFQEGSQGVLMNGRYGTELISFSRSRFFQKLLEADAEDRFWESLLTNWLKALDRYMLPEAIPGKYHYINPKDKLLTAEKGDLLRTTAPILWLQPRTGSLSSYRWNKEPFGEEDQFLPLTSVGWLMAEESSEISIYCTKDFSDYQPLEQALFRAHEVFTSYLAHQQQKARESWKENYTEKQKFNQWFARNSLTQLISVTEKTDEVLPGEVVPNPLLAACQIIGRKQHIDIPASIDKVLSADSKDPLAEIARAACFNTRKVLLRSGWHQQDLGPLLAFRNEDENPVALIPESPSRYRLHDPKTGETYPVTDKVAEEFEGFAYYFYRPFPNKAMKAIDLFRFGLTSNWRRDFLLVCLMGIAGGILGMLTPVATGIIFDSVIPEGERSQLLQIGFLLGALALANFLFVLTRSFAMLRIEGKMDGSIQAAVWDRLLALPVPFFKDYTSGELAMRAMGITQIRQAVSGAAVNTILTGFFSLFTFGLLFYYDARLALFATIPVVISILVTLSLGYFQVKYERKLIDFSKEIQGLVLQLFSGIAKFRVAGAENRAFHQWSKAFSQQRQVAFKNETVANVMKTFNAFFPLLTSMLIFYLVITSTSSTLQPGIFIAFNAALGNFIGYMTSMSETFITINAIIPTYQMVTPILETLPEYDDAKGDAGTLTGDIEVSRVSFRYKSGAPLVLKDVSFKIEEGEYVALVGSSGSGKSTLFRVLLGFEKTEAGQVYYNGKDLSKVDIRSVRKQLGVVLQNGQLMQGDIFSNIVGSNPNLTMEDAWDAAKKAGMEDDIKAMPMGMHTIISEGASTLSGGQRQRLLIARAIVNRPRIIYFDEATSALDNKTQKIVSESLDQLNATRIVIAHRLSTIMNCERIIVMDQGKVVEQGTYSDLMEKDGLFAQLARRQLA